MSSDWERGYDAGYRAAIGTARRDIGSDLGRSAPVRTKKKARKVSAYSKRYGAEFRKLKKKHPRMSFASLSKKAHRAAKKGGK